MILLTLFIISGNSDIYRILGSILLSHRRQNSKLRRKTFHRFWFSIHSFGTIDGQNCAIYRFCLVSFGFFLIYAILDLLPGTQLKQLNVNNIENIFRIYIKKIKLTKNTGRISRATLWSVPVSRIYTQSWGTGTRAPLPLKLSAMNKKIINWAESCSQSEINNH